MSGSIRCSAIELLDPENWGLAVDISFLGVIEAEIRLWYASYLSIYILPVWRPPSWIFHFHIPCTVSTIEPRYRGPRKCVGSRWNFVPMCHRTWDTLMFIIYECRNIYHRFGGRHFGISGGSGVAKNAPFCSPIIFRKSHQSVPVNSERFRNGSEKIGLGVILPPLSTWGLTLT